MRRYVYYYLLVFFAVSCSFRAYAVEYYFKRISIEQGLSHATVNTILRDNRGMLWVGTRQGLNRIDRSGIKKYFDPTSDGKIRQESNVFHLFEDEYHNLWAITDRGLFLYLRDQDTFVSKVSQHVQSVCAIEGGVLFGGYSAIYFYDYKTESIVRLPLHRKNTLPEGDYSIIYLQPIDSRRILVGTENNGIFIYSMDDASFKLLIATGDTPLSSLFKDNESGDIYFSVFQKGLYRYTRSGKLLKHEDTSNSGLSNNIVLDIKKYHGRLWLATDGGGISILDTKTNNITTIKHIPGAVYSLPVNSIKTLYEDSKGNLWAGTVRDGLFLLKEAYIRTYGDVTLGSSNGLSERVVISLFEDAVGKLWIGTDGGGLNRFDPKTETFTHYLDTYNDKIVSITDFVGTSLLVSRYGKGLSVYHPESRLYTPFTIINEHVDAEECHSGFMPVAYKITHTTVLILAKNAYFYHLGTKGFTRLHFARGTKPRFSLQMACKDGDKVLLSKDNVLYFLRPNGKISSYMTFNEHLLITSVCYEKQANRLWIATSGGLYTCLFGSSGKVKKVATNMFGRITAMQLDDENRLWINASNMLFSYNTKTGKCMVWDDSDGFLPNDILTTYVCPSISPYIYMGGINGLVKINKHIIGESPVPVSIYLQSVEFDGRLYTVETFPRAIPQSFNSLRININLDEKDFFRHILFRYRIRGRQLNSVRETYSASLDITSLASGDYDIYVACMTKDGNWTTEVPLISFKVMQPWYKRLWFILSAVVIVLVVMSLVMLWLIRRNQQRMKWKMAVHQQALNEDKIRFLTNVSHELRTPLTLIYAPLKRLLLSGSEVIPSQLRRQIEGVFRQANHMKNIINWVLDYDKNTSLSDNLNISFTDLNHLITDILTDFAQEFKEKRIRTVLKLENTLRPIAIDSAKIRVVISNLLMNALKFSRESSSVTIRSSADSGMLRVQIEDRGIGLKGVSIDRLFTRFYQGRHQKMGNGIGLAYCKELIEKHSGRIGACENPGGGTIMYFDLPYHIDQRIGILGKDAKACVSVPVSVSTDTYNLSTYSMLIVDDNSEFLQFLRAELQPLFKQVVKAHNGEEALHILKNQQLDIVVSDVMMPIMDGYQLCKCIKEDIDVSHIPVILLTAKSDGESQRIGYKLGADAYLSKPFDTELLVSVIETQLRRKELLKRKYSQNPLELSPQTDTISNADEQFMLKLNTVIKENYADADFDISDVIAYLGMSRASLYNKMKQLTGIGVNEYINKYRIVVACNLLKQTRKSIADIAFETGFSSQRYFSTVFKNVFGLTPSAYRTGNWA